MRTCFTHRIHQPSIFKMDYQRSCMTGSGSGSSWELLTGSAKIPRSDSQLYDQNTPPEFRHERKVLAG